WGVLLRPDRQGQPRYAGPEVLKKLGCLARGEGGRDTLRLACHLCGDDCRRVIRGDVDRVRHLHGLLGFGRLQLNPTKANDPGGWEPAAAAEGVRAVATALPEVEFILQLNEETQALFERLFHDPSCPAPTNLVVLLDASCGLGKVPDAWARPPEGVRCGFAGGLGPDTVLAQLDAIAAACKDSGSSGSDMPQSVWIDMESGIRSQESDRGDIFDLERVRKVVKLIRGSGFLKG
ncbi:unnamed protein product, partial [Polarella glacialis]